MIEIFTGIDIVDNRRFKKALDRYGEKFINRIFNSDEIDYCKEKVKYFECLAARFAAKEAAIKAFYSAFNIRLGFKDITVKGRNRQPAEILLHPEKNKKLLLSKPYKSSVSISHEKDFSVAIVLVYRL